MVCDDSKLVRALLVKMLSSDPTIQVVGEAENGYECLELVKSVAPDVVLLDVVMPVLNGLQVLREAQERGLTTQFLVVSEYGSNDEARNQALLAAGAIGVLVRPHAILQIDSMLPHLLERLHQIRDRIELSAHAEAPQPARLLV